VLAALLVCVCFASQALAGEIRYEIYMVRSGDTVENIAGRFGVAADRIRSVNNLPSDAVLQAGQSLAVLLDGAPRAENGEQTGASGIGGGVAVEIPPQYAVVGAQCRITAECGGGEELWEPALGSRVIVRWEQGDYWGVVMMGGEQGWVPKSALQVTEQRIAPEVLATMIQGSRPDIVQYAYRFLGTPYRYGGRLPDDVDCSLFVQTVFAAHNIRLPRTAHAQVGVGYAVSYQEMQPGDRLYFASSSGHVNHTGIYVGDGQFIHASSRARRVTVDSLMERAYWSHLVAVRRS
jgi:cell wall-associated NlpC family hydrolase